MTNSQITLDAQWMRDTLTDALETLQKAVTLLEEDPRHARGVLEHEMVELYAKLNYAVNTAEIGPDAINTVDHDRLVAWPESLPFSAMKASSRKRSKP